MKKKKCSQSINFPNNRINPIAANQCVQERKVCGPAEEKMMTCLELETQRLRL